MMTDWAQTERRSVRLVLAEGLGLQGEIHLQPRVAWRDGPETPVEMLNRDEAFFPVNLPDGGIVFVAKAQVASVAFADPASEADPARRSAMHSSPLEVMMVNGIDYTGTAITELPPNRSRDLDFLNSRERFFLLLTDGGSVCINRHFVRAVRPLS